MTTRPPLSENFRGSELNDTLSHFDRLSSFSALSGEVDTRVLSDYLPFLYLYVLSG